MPFLPVHRKDAKQGTRDSFETRAVAVSKRFLVLRRPDATAARQNDAELERSALSCAGLSGELPCGIVKGRTSDRGTSRASEAWRRRVRRCESLCYNLRVAGHAPQK